MKRTLAYSLFTTYALVLIVLLAGWFWPVDASNQLLSHSTTIIAHRGYSSLFLENTLKAFEEAGKANFDGIECDIYVTLDQKIVISHDDNLKRLTGVDKLISQSTFDEIKTIPYLKDPTQTPATLNDYLAICKTYQKRAIIEIKETVKVEHIRLIYDTVINAGVNDFAFIAFNLEHLISLRAIDASLELHYLARKYSPNYLKTCAQYQLIPSMNYKSLTKPLIELFHQNGLKVGAWTVDDISVANQLILDGIDYLTTNKLVE